MNELEHLTSEAREEAALPDAERISRIRAERYIHYGLAETALVRMNELLEYHNEIECRAFCSME